jgi:plastocyanin
MPHAHDPGVRICALLIVAALAGCTPGAQAAGSATTGTASTTIDVSLTSSMVSATPYGTSGGFSPSVTTVALGSSVRFVNVDAFAHTATSIAAATFPSSSPFGSAALDITGSTLSGGWSSGSLGAGTASQTLLADARGTYLYGCFFHYSAPMRGAIVVQ